MFDGRWNPFSLVAVSSFVTISFTSDESVAFDGFELSYVGSNGTVNVCNVLHV